MTGQEVAGRFARETARHQMTVLHDQGLYRHLRFRDPESSMYWFDLITIPGTLMFQGDGECFAFRRITDMFEFFRGQRINPIYWSEKLISNRDAAKRYDPDLFRAYVTETFVDRARWGGVPSGTGLALRQEVLEYADYEHEARAALDDFDHQGFRFSDTWEVSFHGFDWWFLWALHAIVWGIAQYDGATTQAPSAEAIAVVGTEHPRALPAGRVETLEVGGDLL